MDDLGLVEAIDRFREGIVVTIADAADRPLDACFPEALGILDRDVLAASVAVMHEPAAMRRLPVMEGLLERIDDEARVVCSCGPPADNAPRIGVYDEGDIDKAGPGRDVGEIRDPQRIRVRGVELGLAVAHCD